MPAKRTNFANKSMRSIGRRQASMPTFISVGLRPAQDGFHELAIKVTLKESHF
jgi:hypothetical protein